MKLTPEVDLTDDLLYLVRCNKEELCFVGSKEEAVLTLDSLAHSEVERLQDEGGHLKVFREDLGDGSIVISTQKLGLIYDGVVVKAFVYDAIPVARVVYWKSRREVPEEGLDCEKREEVPASLQAIVAKYASTKGTDAPMDT